MTVKKTIKSAVLTLAILTTALLPAQTLMGETTAKSPDYKDLRLFRQVMGIVQKHYVKDVSDKELVQVFNVSENGNRNGILLVESLGR